MSGRDAAAEQLNGFKKGQGNADRMTTGGGAPVGDKLNIQTVGPRGPALLQDVVFLDEMSHFDRERIPERVVHAKGAGAFGFFEVTHDITRYTKAKIFEHVGKKTPMVLRFSTVGGEKGSADTARDPRGYAMKFYTEEGNWDLVGNNTPIFFIRDPMLFPSFIHTQKRNPVTNLKDHDMFWDFISLRPETTHQVSFLFSDRGTPDGFRFMNGYGSHTFKLVNKDGEAVYCKFHCKTDQGIKNLMADVADDLSGKDPDYATRDLFNNIAAGNFPSWTMYIQVMTFEQAEKFRFNPFDLTKVWPHKEYPLIPVGRFTLNRNPTNYHAEIEQSAFAPSNFVPGIEASPDKMLQGRLFSYHDTHIHRLGTNYLQIPVNTPQNAKGGNYQRDGFMAVNGNQAGAPNYYPNSFSGPVDDKKCVEHRQTFTGTADVTRFNSADEDNFTQVGIFYNQVLSEAERDRLTSNIAGHMSKAQEFIQKRAVRNFSQADPDYGKRIQQKLDAIKAASAGQMESGQSTPQQEEYVIKDDATVVNEGTTEEKIETTEVKIETTEEKAEVNGGKTEAIDVKTETVEATSEPLYATVDKTQSYAVTAETTEVKTETTDVKTETTDVKTETTDVKTETTEEKIETTDVTTEEKADINGVKTEASGEKIEPAVTVVKVEKTEEKTMEKAKEEAKAVMEDFTVVNGEVVYEL